MLLGKLRVRIAEIRKKHPHMDISITIPYHLPDDYFTISVFDSSNRFIERRSMPMSYFDTYSGDVEELLIMILDKLVEDAERSP